MQKKGLLGPTNASNFLKFFRIFRDFRAIKKILARRTSGIGVFLKMDAFVGASSSLLKKNIKKYKFLYKKV